MDILEASRRGLPWCARCETTNGPFVIRRTEAEMALLCERCATPIRNDRRSEDNPEQPNVEDGDARQEHPDRR